MIKRYKRNRALFRLEFLLIGVTAFTLNVDTYQVLAMSKEDAIKSGSEQAEKLKDCWEQNGGDISSYEHSDVFSCTVYSGDGITASGKPTVQGETIAVDPDVIPLGTEVIICGHKFIAEDTGGVVKGNVIDIFLQDASQCDAFGRRNLIASWNGSGGKESTGKYNGEELTPETFDNANNPFPMNVIMGTPNGTTSAVTNNGQQNEAESNKTVSLDEYGNEDDIPDLEKEPNWGGSTVTLPSSDDLSPKENIEVKRWGEDIKAKKESSVISFFRACVASAGLWLIIYSVLMYLAYWLDRVNNLFEFSCIGLLSRGKLVLSPDGVSTFSKAGEIKAIVHKDVIKICITAIAMGVVLLTGRLYLFIQWLIKVFNYIVHLI